MNQIIRSRLILVTLFMSFILLISSCSNQTSIDFPYDSEEPMTTPTILGEGVISTDDEPVWAFTFTPDGKKIYVLRGVARSDTLYESEYIDGKWTEPILFTFPSPQNVHFLTLLQPFISPDGSKFFFTSVGEGMEGYDLWVSKNIDGEWGEPTILDVVNSPQNEDSSSVAGNGNLYFYSNRSGSSGGDIYISKFLDGTYTQPERMDEQINTSGSEGSPFIAPDESYLIFSRDAAFYISFYSDGKWSEAEMLPGEPLNGFFGTRFSPFVSPDKKYFFYANGDIQQVDASVIGLDVE